MASVPFNANAGSIRGVVQAANPLPDMIGPYQVLGGLGEGATGIVYRVQDAHGRMLALKVLRPELSLSDRERGRFLEEAVRLRRVRHPALVEVVDSGVLPNGLPFIAMPCYGGESLAERLRRAPMRFDVALHLFEQLAEALQALHREGLVHRDVKPENIFVTEGDRQALLLDLGIARDANASPSTTTHAGLIRGTPAYMAPERFFGAPATAATDIYELGVVLYVTLVGALPWLRFDDPTERMKPAAPSARGVVLPARLSSTLMRALAVSPGERPQSAAEFAHAVIEAMSPESAQLIANQATSYVHASGTRNVVTPEPVPSHSHVAYAPTTMVNHAQSGAPSYGPPMQPPPYSAAPATPQPAPPTERKRLPAMLIGAMTGATLLASGGLALVLFVRSGANLEAPVAVQSTPQQSPAVATATGAATQPSPAVALPVADPMAQKQTRPAARAATPLAAKTTTRAEKDTKVVVVAPNESVEANQDPKTNEAEHKKDEAEHKKNSTQGGAGGGLAASEAKATEAKGTNPPAPTPLPTPPPPTIVSASLANCEALRSYMCMPQVEAAKHGCFTATQDLAFRRKQPVEKRAGLDGLCAADLRRLAQSR